MAEGGITTVNLELLTNSYHHKPYAFISPNRPELSAEGKNVVVTGGGTGIGKAIAIAFAQAGAKSVIIIGRRHHILQSAVEEIQLAGAKRDTTKVAFEVADLTVEKQVVTALDNVRSRFGPLHILVSNAGSLPTTSPVTEYPSQALLRILELNVISTLHVLKAFKPVASLDSAVVININSSMAHAKPLPALGISAYSVSKAANLKLVDYFAAENPEIHVVNVQPGIVATDMADKSQLNSDLNQDEPELAGHFAVWAASPEALFLRGKFVWANWDAEELLKRSEEIQSCTILECGLNTSAIEMAK
ncbi:hypothetical protein F4824DRAFT_482607 [Ustulina deusta]|nr:hypothetical protein F4824DRAFT_482607 [Ustulina deusta]